MYDSCVTIKPDAFVKATDTLFCHSNLVQGVFSVIYPMSSMLRLKRLFLNKNRAAIASAVSWFLVSMSVSHGQVIDTRVPLELIRGDFGLADGPCWDGNGLVVPDVKGDCVYRYQPKINRWTTLIQGSGRISASFFNHGRIYLSDNAEAAVAFVDGGSKRSIALFQADHAEGKASSGKPYRPNDLVVDSSGGMYVTMTARGEVLYVSANGKVEVAADEIETPNGIILSPDEKTLYVASFVPKKILAYDVKGGGQLANQSVFAEMDSGAERGADGMSMDRAGNIYCAGPDAIWLWNPKGNLIGKIQCPSKPINCVFGDSDMRSLYITCMDGLYRQRMMISGCSPRPIDLPLKPAAKQSRELPPHVASTTVPDSIEVEWNVVYGQQGSRKLLADLFLPKQQPQSELGKSERRRALIVVHGGGWHSGDKTKFQALSIKLASRGYVVAAIEYRLADEAEFPAAIDDCFSAVRYLRANADRFNIEPQQIGAVGGSAGGHLVGLMASGSDNAVLIGKGANREVSSSVQAAVVMAGPMEMLTGSVADKSRNQPKQSNANRWLRATVDEAPDLYRAADAYAQIDEKTAPILFLVGEHDLPSRNQPSREKLQRLGIKTGLRVFADGKHGCWNRLPWMDQMVDEMVDFFAVELR